MYVYLHQYLLNLNVLYPDKNANNLPISGPRRRNGYRLEATEISKGKINPL